MRIKPDGHSKIVFVDGVLVDAFQSTTEYRIGERFSIQKHCFNEGIVEMEFTVKFTYYDSILSMTIIHGITDNSDLVILRMDEEMHYEEFVLAFYKGYEYKFNYGANNLSDDQIKSHVVNGVPLDKL